MNTPQYSQDWVSDRSDNFNKIFENFKLIGKDNLTFLEIGCFEGRCTNFFLDTVLTEKNSKIHVIDTFTGSQNEGSWHQKSRGEDLLNRFKANTSNYTDKIVIHRGLSCNRLKDSDLVNDMFDFIYVDGSHKTWDVLTDAVLCHNLLKNNGVIIFDDYLWKDPKNSRDIDSPELGINFFLHCFRDYYRIVFSGYQVALRKI